MNRGRPIRSFCELTLLLLLTSAIACCGVKNSNQVYADQAVWINGGQPIGHSALSSSTVLLIQVDRSHKIQSYCSGTLLTLDIVLTAAHCLLDSELHRSSEVTNSVYIGDRVISTDWKYALPSGEILSCAMTSKGLSWLNSTGSPLESG